MRLFFGLSLPPSAREATADYARRAAQAVPGRYALPDNHHITLAFLGEVPPEREGEARAVLSRCAAAFPAPRVTIAGPSHFGREENAIFTLRAQSEPSLDPLHASLTDALGAAELPFDPGPFSPHVTLARHAHLSGADVPPFEPICFTATRAALFLSARDEADTLRYTERFWAEFMP